MLAQIFREKKVRYCPRGFDKYKEDQMQDKRIWA